MTANVQASPLISTYETVKTPLHTMAWQKIKDWKEESPYMGRKIVYGLAITGLAIAGVVDIAASIALGILSSPLELAGYQFSRNFFIRSGLGVLTTIILLTIEQYDNIKGNL
jgi:hypothetical protein